MILRSALLLATLSVSLELHAQTTPAPPPTAPPHTESTPTTPAPQQTPSVQDETGPQTDSGAIILKKKKDAPDAPPIAPSEPKIKNPNGDTYSLRVDVPIVSLDVNVILDKTHQFVPGLKAGNFLVLEDGQEQQVQSVRVTQTPITAVMLLEFAANSYAYIYDMQNASAGFYHSLKADDYVAVITYDLRTHILTDFTNDKNTVADSLRSLTIPGFSDTDMFDALYETLDRVSRIEGRKYIILIGSGRDTFSRINLDKMLAKVKATPNVTIFTIATGALATELRDARGGLGAINRMDILQAQNQLQTFARMTGGLYFNPMFQGALPDIFREINDSIRNEYVLTYRPTNAKNDGSYRRIKVTLVDNEGKPLHMQDEKQKPLKYTVIARDGYKAKLPVE